MAKAQNAKKELPKSLGQAIGAKRVKAALPPSLAENVMPGLDALAQTVPGPKTELQKVIGEAAKSGAAAMERPEIVQTVGSMISFRQMYAVAYRELQHQLEKGDYHPATEDMLVQAALHASSKPFSEHTLMRGMMETVMPWLARVVDSHTEADAEAERQEKEIAEAARKTRPVPIGFKHTGTQTAPGLDRDRGLVLVGWQPALDWLLAQAVNSVLTDNEGQIYTVVRFAAASLKRGEQQQQYIRVPPADWKGCANTNDSMAKTMGAHVASQLTYQPDLLIIDDMEAACQTSFFGRPPGATAGDANKKIRKWCQEAGCAFIGCVPVDDKNPDIGAPEYEQLKTFSYLRPLIVVEHGTDFPGDPIPEGHSRIIVGGHCAVWDVPNDVLAGYARSNIIVTGE